MDIPVVSTVAHEKGAQAAPSKCSEPLRPSAKRLGLQFRRDAMRRPAGISSA